MDNETQLRTTKAAADYLGVTVNTVKNYARQGKLPVVKFSSRAYRFRLDDLEEFIAKSRVSADDDSA